MTEKQLYVGDKWKPIFLITDPETGAAVDPTDLKADFQDPSGKVTTATCTRLSTGRWRAEQKLTLSGTWHCTPRATGEYEGVETIERSVKKAPSP